ncbi:MAG: F0F1 ATP synthase subunit delta [Rhodospirillales bacterium]|nr:F0F1 ATP synthase subunit delta [Rhodospirillales bacterium]
MATETSISSGIAIRYATALYELADEGKQLDQVAADLAKLKAMVGGSVELQQLISSPLIPRDRQQKAMMAVIERSDVGDLARRFVGTLARNRRLFLLPQVVDAFARMLADHRGEIRAEVVSAAPLTPPQVEAVGAALRGTMGAKVSVDLKVDPAILGGLKVKVGSRLIDASLAAKLQRLQLAMKGLR